jgi:hypothetical protein
LIQTALPRRLERTKALPVFNQADEASSRLAEGVNKAIGLAAQAAMAPRLSTLF